MPRYVIVDRDGTLIRHVPYLHEPSRVEVLPTVCEGLKALRSSGCLLFMHTNQSGIGRGYFKPADVDACNAEMLRQLGLGHDLFERICICPEIPNEQATFRKPSPRFGLEILDVYRAKNAELCYIGDSVVDLEAADNVGCSGFGVNTGLQDLPATLASRGLGHRFKVFPSFGDAANHVISLRQQPLT